MEDYLVQLLALSAVLFVFCIVLYVKLAYLTKRYREFMAGGNGASLEEFLRTIHDDLRSLRGEVLENRRRMAEQAETLNRAVRGIGVVRFNAFQDTGSDLSFAVAYLDAYRNGVVISSIYGREESRTYAKPIENCSSTYQLSQEEQDALAKAAASLESGQFVQKK